MVTYVNFRRKNMKKIYIHLVLDNDIIECVSLQDALFLARMCLAEGRTIKRVISNSSEIKKDIECSISIMKGVKYV